ncbi:hypothetical protein H5410_031070, partial [Solanum commersonii]
MIEDDYDNTIIPLSNVTSKILAKVIEYCKRHLEVPKPEDKTNKGDLKTFDAEFVKMIILSSFDGDTFELDEAVGLESHTIKHMIEDDYANTIIPLPNVTSKILTKVIEYCKRHVEVPKAKDKTAKEDLKTFDAKFLRVDQSTLFNLMLMIILSIFDGETFEVDEEVALESHTIKHMIEVYYANTIIPLLNVISKILSKVIEYYKPHVDVPKAKAKTAKVDVKTFNAEFVKVDQSTLFNLML